MENLIQAQVMWLSKLHFVDKDEISFKVFWIRTLALNELGIASFSEVILHKKGP